MTGSGRGKAGTFSALAERKRFVQRERRRMKELLRVLERVGGVAFFDDQELALGATLVSERVSRRGGGERRSGEGERDKEGGEAEGKER